VGRLVGRFPKGAYSVQVDLDALSSSLASTGIAENLDELARHMFGDLDTAQSKERLLDAAWADLVDQHIRLIPERTQDFWWEFLTQGRRLRRLSHDDLQAAGELLAGVQQVISHLPAKGLTLAQLAAQVSGDSHALDRNRELGRLCAPLTAHLFRNQEAEGIDLDGPAFFRDTWALAGIMVDELSAPALVLNLRPCAGSHFVQEILNAHASKGEPFRLSTRLLLREEPRFSPEVTGPLVYVTENPNVLAAAAHQLGPHSAPLLATEGQEKTAMRLLLGLIRDAGIHILYRGDFDWPGIAIGNLVMARHGARPWRFSKEDYESAPAGKALHGSPRAASWDPTLQSAMQMRGRAVHEESIIDLLLSDLLRN